VVWCKVVNTTRKLQNLSQVEGVLYRLVYLNPEIMYEDMEAFALWLTDSSTGWVVNSFDKGGIQTLCDDVWNNFQDGKVYVNKVKRMLLFNPSLRSSDRCRIIGGKFRRSVKYSANQIYEIVQELMLDGKPLTADKIAKKLKCSTVTISRNMDDETKGIISEYNIEARKNEKMEKIGKAIRELLDNSKDKALSIRQIRKLSSIPDQYLIKEALKAVKG